MIHLFCGYDQREAIGFHVFTSSVLRHASVPVAVHALAASGLPEGSNSFTYSRFLVPHLMGFKGRAIFADACDMLMLGDIAELDGLFDSSLALQVVKHRYTTRHPIKYRGTSMECPNVDYPRKNWASLMLINCEHRAWSSFTPEVLGCVAKTPRFVLSFEWLADGFLGALPDRWNRLVDEGQPVDGASLLHWTAGIPAFPHYAKAPGAEAWFAERDRMLEIA